MVVFQLNPVIFTQCSINLVLNFNESVKSLVYKFYWENIIAFQNWSKVEKGIIKYLPKNWSILFPELIQIIRLQMSD